MKYYKTINDVIEAWLDKSSHDGHTHGSVWFNGDTIYSYGRHFPVAQRVICCEGEVYYFTSRGYSVTTSQHKSAVMSQLSRHGCTVFFTPQPNSPFIHEDTVKYHRDMIEYFKDKASRARSRKQHYLDMIVHYQQCLNDYMRIFGADITTEALRKAM